MDERWEAFHRSLVLLLKEGHFPSSKVTILNTHNLKEQRFILPYGFVEALVHVFLATRQESTAGGE